MDQAMQNQFEQDYSELNLAALVELLENNVSPCWETDLIQAVLPELNLLDRNALKLYKAHFLLFHSLYKLKDSYIKKGKYLHINFMKTFLVNFPETGKCRYYDEDSGLFCNADSVNETEYCDFHLSKNETDSIDFISDRFFYLDVKNYFSLDESTADAFLNGAWELLNNYSTYRDSCKILDLPEGTGISIVKNRFRHLAKKYHPDISEENYQIFSKINTAYRNIIKYIKIR